MQVVSDTRYSKGNGDMQAAKEIPVTQLNGDMQAAKREEMRHLPAVDRFKRYGRYNVYLLLLLFINMESFKNIF